MPKDERETTVINDLLAAYNRRDDVAFDHALLKILPTLESASLPGSVLVHFVIGDECRQNRGDAGALDYVINRLVRGYESVVAGWSPKSGVKIHVALTVERPEDSK